MDFALGNYGLQFEQWDGPELNELHHSRGYLQNSGCALVVRVK